MGAPDDASRADETRIRAFGMPANLADAAAADGRLDWLERLPPIVAEVAASWSLRLGKPYEPGGMTAWVAPVTDASGRPRVLKVGWRHPEAEDEGLGLRTWAGRGTVLLHAERKLGDTFALLLERCDPGVTLASRPEPEQDEVITGLLPRLWIESPRHHGFRPLSQMCAQWADAFERNLAAGQAGPKIEAGRAREAAASQAGPEAGRVRKAPASQAGLDPGLARAGVALFRELPATAASEVLLCTDLHAENVLSSQRERWLVIDPKPYVGDPAYDPLQHMLNCAERLQADPRGLAAAMADPLGLDRERLLLWLFARCVIESAEWPNLADVARQIPPP
jgi:streptomycin 6-kinase